MRLTRALGTLGLVFVMFFQVSGGPFTTEVLVSQVGPGLALLLLCVLPIVWALPEGLLIAELASMLPEEGGYYAWVRRAFGPFWAFQNGWLTWCYSLVDMALYPVLFTLSLKHFFPGLTPTESWLASLGMIWLALVINLRGAGRVGWASVAVGCFVIAGFALLALAALPRATHLPWVPFAKVGEKTTGALGVGLSLALWNFIGWDNASTVEGEIQDPSRTYPRAIAIAVPLVASMYLLTLLPTLAATDWTTWHEGGWPDIARAAAGPYGAVLAPWLALAGMGSAFALFNAYLLTYSRIPLVLAADGLLPPAVARTDERGTPRTAVIVSALFYSIFALLPLGELVVADVLLYALALILEFASLVQLRRREPTLRGAFRVPVGTVGIAAIAALPVLTIAVIAGMAMRDGELGLPAVTATAVLVAVGPAIYRWRVAVRGRREASAPPNSPY